MDTKLFIMIFAAAFLSSLSQTVTGFGSAIVMMALFPLFIPSDVSLTLSLIFGGLMSAWLLWKYREGIRLRYILMPVFFPLWALSQYCLSAQRPLPLFICVYLVFFFCPVRMVFVFCKACPYKSCF